MGRGKSAASRELIAACYDILAEIQPASVRAVCYRLFVAGLLKNMSKNETNRVSTQLVWARKNGNIPDAWIVDETESIERPASWDHPAEYADAIEQSYRKNFWATQRTLVEVWSEKGTVRGTLAPVLDRYGVAFRVFGGFASYTVVKGVARASKLSTQPLEVLYVGDHDPSGMYMSEEDLPARLEEYRAERLLLRRVALTTADRDSGDLVPFSADTKTADTRHRWYVRRYGTRCAELDAMNPTVLRERVEAAIVAHIDGHAWARAKQTEELERASLFEVVGQWRLSLGA